ncbi:MAG: DUF2911 domain-containing protein, partial [Pedobacter sp.]
MKKVILFSTALILSLGLNVIAQDVKTTAPAAAKPAPASPPATASQTLSNGTQVTINYAQPAIKGRTIGNEIAPYGKLWRTGANAATQFEVNKAVKVNGKALAAGKYALFSIPGEQEWTIIINKTWNQGGTSKY